MRTPTLSLFVLTGLVACAPDARTVTTPNATAVAAVETSDYTSWSPAVSVEEGQPGADPALNTMSLDGCPFVGPNDRTFYLASNRPGGKGGIDIWVATRARREDPWGAPVNAGEPVNSSADDFCPTIARDGHTLYFVSRRQVGVRGMDWCGGSDIYVTRSRDDHGFDTPRNLGCNVNSAGDEFSPFPVDERASGPVLYFSSTRAGLGTGGDLYRSESQGGIFGPASLVSGVNSAVDDEQPNLRRDGLELFFYSNRSVAGAQGGNDIYVSFRASTSDPWSTPVNLGPNVNSSASETRPSLSWDGTTLYFGSNRLGSEAVAGAPPSSDIYVTRRESRRSAGV